MVNLIKSKIFLLFCISFIVGVLAGGFANYQMMIIAAMVCIMAGTIFWQNRIVFILSIAGIVALLGALRFQLDFRQNDLVPYYKQKVSVTGVVSTEPDVRADKTQLTLDEVSIEGKNLQSKLLVVVWRYPEYEYGQKIILEGKVVEAKEFPDFSYKNYLSRFGIDGIVYYPQISETKTGFGNPIKRAVYNFKNKFTDNLSAILPEPQNAFLAGLLLGAKRSMPQELIDQFNTTGTSHIVAVSGYNITIIAWGLDKLLQRFRKRIAFSLSLLGIVLFVIATGASASVVRAGIMGSMLLIALNIGRLYAISNALALTAVVMLAINPQILLFDIGFQLSFLALMGLVYLMPMLARFDTHLPDFLETALFATLSAQIFTLPILLINFGRLSIVAPLANILVLGAVPLTMLFGFLTGIFSFIHPMLALPFSWVAWLLLSYIIKVVQILSVIPLASVGWQANWWFGAGYYLILAIIMILWKQKQETFSNT